MFVHSTVRFAYMIVAILVRVTVIKKDEVTIVGQIIPIFRVALH